MKLFTLDDQLRYKDVSRSYIRFRTALVICCLFVIGSLFLGFNQGIDYNGNNVIIDTVHKNTVDTLTLTQDNEFSHQKFADLLYAINVKYPHIVMAQAIIESGNFTSSIFRNNNNMFGMRLPRSRSTTAIGEKNGFACYTTWKDCVYDYALYQSQAMRTCSTEEEYYKALEERYAQDTAYVPALKATITNQHLRSLFYE